MREYYYTSTRHGVTGSAGFQCKAKSPSLSAEDVRIINNMIGYRIPPTLNETDIATHPPALRYEYIGPDKCVLSNSQSNGPDENGRPGNFFAHAVMTQPDDFQIYPPIMFWRSKFWKSEDNLNRIDLPETPSFDTDKIEPSLDLDQMWAFLQERSRQEWFRSLLSAVIRYDTDKRPVVILDDVDNVALWIAAVTLALPGNYRPFLSFATYHHDPYQASFRIIGTTGDSRFRFSADEYVSYFLLNAEANRISEVRESAYANFVAENFNSVQFDSNLLAFFEVCNRHLPSRSFKHLNSKLDAVTEFYLMFYEQRVPLSSPDGRKTLDSYLSDMEQRSTLNQDDVEELSNVADGLLQSVADDISPQALQNYGRILSLLRQHDAGFSNRCHRDLPAWLHTLTVDVSAAERHFNVLEQSYGAALGECAGQDGFPAKLSTSLSRLSWQAYQLVWGRVIPLLGPGHENKRVIEAILAQTLSVCNGLALPGDRRPNQEAQSLMETVVGRSDQSSSFLLSAAMDWNRREGGPAFYWLYYELVRNLPLSDRLPLRNTVSSVAQNLVLYEVEQDSRFSRIEDQSLRLTEWLEHLHNEPNLRMPAVSTWLNAQWGSASQAERKQIADQVLFSQAISQYLEQSWEAQLLGSFLAGLMLKRLSPDTTELYKRFSNNGGLNIQQQALLNGSLAITEGKFPPDSIPIIYEWLNGMDGARYQAEATKFIEAFFREGITIEAHSDMVRAVYSTDHDGLFWDVYWSHFQAMISDVRRVVESANLFAFWFEDSVTVLQNCKYLVPSFFLELPIIIEEILDEKSNQRAMEALARHIAREEWYPAIAECFTQRKRGLSGLLQRK